MEGLEEVHPQRAVRGRVGLFKRPERVALEVRLHGDGVVDLDQPAAVVVLCGLGGVDDGDGARPRDAGFFGDAVDFGEARVLSFNGGGDDDFGGGCFATLDRRSGVLGLLEEEDHKHRYNSHEDGAVPEGPLPALRHRDVSRRHGTEIVADDDEHKIDSVHGPALMHEEEIRDLENSHHCGKSASKFTCVFAFSGFCLGG